MKPGEKVALLAIIVNFILFIVKYAAAFFSGSISLKAEAFHTFADLIGSVTVFIGLKLAKRKSKLFPYGLYKIENIFSVIIAGVIFYTGYEIALEAKNITVAAVAHSEVIILSLLFSIAVTFLFARYEKKVGQKINSPMILADAAHIHMDVLSNIVVLGAILSNLMGYHIEKFAAFIVVLFIIKTGWHILIDGLRVLLDASIDPESLGKVVKIMEQVPEVVEIKMLTGRSSGAFKFIEATIVLQTHDLDKAHFLVDKIEYDVKKAVSNIDQMLIHYEPVEKEDLLYAVPLTDDKSRISEHFGEAKYFLLAAFKKNEKKPWKVECVNNPYSISEKSKGILTAEFLVTKGVAVILVKNAFDKKGPAYVFSDKNIEVILTTTDIPSEAFKEISLSL